MTLAALIADQAEDMRTGHRARDVFDPHSIPFLPTDDGLPRYSRGLRLVSIAHGTLYAYKRLRCRCSECRAVNASWQRGYRQRTPQRSRPKDSPMTPPARPQGLIR